MSEPNVIVENTLTALQFGTQQYCPVCSGWNVGPHGTTYNVHTKKCHVPKAIELAKLQAQAVELLRTLINPPVMREGRGWLLAALVTSQYEKPIVDLLTSINEVSKR